MVTPLMLIVMSFMDIIFILNEVILGPTAYLIEYLSCGKIKINWIIEKIDDIYEWLFLMQNLDAAGFRRMRTIT